MGCRRFCVDKSILDHGKAYVAPIRANLSIFGLWDTLLGENRFLGRLYR